MVFPGSPRLLKGAIVGLDPLNPLASVVIFQYNPDTLTRTVQARAAGGGGGDTSQSEALRLKGPPEETIRLDVEVDAADQLERADAIAGQFGVAPALASLEMLLYPKSALVIANEVLAALGIIEVIPPEAPLTLFVWGLKRVLPVRLTELSITEDAFAGSFGVDPFAVSWSFGSWIAMLCTLTALVAFTPGAGWVSSGMLRPN